MKNIRKSLTIYPSSVTSMGTSGMEIACSAARKTNPSSEIYVEKNFANSAGKANLKKDSGPITQTRFPPASTMDAWSKFHPKSASTFAKGMRPSRNCLRTPSAGAMPPITVLSKYVRASQGYNAINALLLISCWMPLNAIPAGVLSAPGVEKRPTVMRSATI